ncbi:DUF4349 domain-containing protein [Streptomyces mexicanus]|uniref:DUF4349 domain-containing protein n=1 Tax=Streptomyces mexicanus TaxID=178566 RepID=UPI0036639F6A
MCVRRSDRRSTRQPDTPSDRRSTREPDKRSAGRSLRSARPASALAALLLAAALTVAGCSAGGDSGGSSDSKAAARGTAGGQAQQDAPGTGGGAASSTGGAASGAKATAAPKATSQVIRTAALTVEVEDVPKALDAARAAAEDADGYVGDETTTRDEEGHERTRVVLRVPAARYDEVLTALQGTGTLVERTARAQDVTDQVVDVDSRIRSQRASVARVRALMDKAGDLSEVVRLEGELSRREADLESLLAQQASLKDRTRLATITLSLSEKPAGEQAAAHDEPGFADALGGGWHVFVTLVRWLVLALGAVLPFAVAAALLVLVWLRLVRPRLPRRAASSTAAGPATYALGPLPAARRASGPDTRPAPDAWPAPDGEGAERD